MLGQPTGVTDMYKLQESPIALSTPQGPGMIWAKHYTGAGASRPNLGTAVTRHAMLLLS